MASLFDFPMDKFANVSDGRAHHSDTDGAFREQSIFVGGRYQEKHDNIFNLFKFNETSATMETKITEMVVTLFSAAPIFTILTCQIGFACLMSGASRAGNAAMPFVVNFLNLATSALSYWGIGYALGRSGGFYLVGYEYWFGYQFPASLSLDWILYYSLALTTVNIASFGAMERSPLWLYAILAAIIAGVVYPVSGYWSWHHEGWLHTFSIGSHAQYQDLGGCGVIHVVGGMSALVSSAMFGPRHEKCPPRKARLLMHDIAGHSLPLELLGGYLVLICFTCTNSIRILVTCIGCDVITEFSKCLANTVISGSTSCVVTLILVALLKLTRGSWRLVWLLPRLILNGFTAGVVAVAAGCDVYSPWGACVVGGTAAIGYVLWSLILHFCRVDDPVGIVAVHFGSGIWGVMCVCLFSHKSGLIFYPDKPVVMSLVWNILGVLTIGGVTIVVVGVVLLIMRLAHVIPVDQWKQLHGLDHMFLNQHAYQTPVNHIREDDRESLHSDASTQILPMFPAAHSENEIQGGMYHHEPHFADADNLDYQEPQSPCSRNASSDAPFCTEPKVWFIRRPMVSSTPLDPLSPRKGPPSREYPDI